MNVDHALILCGGESRRMGKEKSSLYYNKEIQYKRIYTLLNTCFTHVFFSISADNSTPHLLNYPHIVDKYNKRCGPILGILSALNAHKVAWFVVAIDMPAITQESILKMLTTRNNHRQNNKTLHASVAFSQDKAFLDPLFAIYEASIEQTICDHFVSKQYSLQKLLKKKSLSISKVDVDTKILHNINTQEEYTLYNKLNLKK